MMAQSSESSPPMSDRFEESSDEYETKTEVPTASSLLSRRQRRIGNVYDAVAGRLTKHGFIAKRTRNSKYLRKSPSTLKPAAAEDIFRARYESLAGDGTSKPVFDNDLGHDKPGQTALPDSDLLKELHTYTADLWASASSDSQKSQWNSMDGTALIALGILVEEAVRESLGASGDMVFTEGEPASLPVLDDDDDEQLPGSMRSSGPNDHEMIHSSSTDGDQTESEAVPVQPPESYPRKRQNTNKSR